MKILIWLSKFIYNYHNVLAYPFYDVFVSVTKWHQLIILFNILQEFRKSHDAELLNTVAAQELKLVTYSKRLLSCLNPFDGIERIRGFWRLLCYILIYLVTYLLIDACLREVLKRLTLCSDAPNGRVNFLWTHIVTWVVHWTQSTGN